MSLMNTVFPVHKMVKKDEIVGDIPSSGSIVKRTFDMAWPSALESVFIALIGAVDMMMVGNLGKEAISAVGIVTQPKFIVLAPILALNISVNVLVARRKGQSDQNAANVYLRQALLISALVAFVLSLSAGLFAKDLLLFAGANDDYLQLAIPYFRYILIGNFFYSVGLTMTAAQRGAGNTKISMKTNLAANVVNLIFNALLINGLFFFPRLEVTGAAIATMIGNIVSFVMALYSVTRKGGFLELSIKDKWNVNFQAMKDIFSISKSSLVEQIFLRIGFFTYAKAVASLGTTDFSAHQVCMNIMHISFAIGDGLQIACTSLVGQSLGARRPDMAMIYGKVSQRIGMMMAMMTAVVITLLRSQLLGFFTTDLEVIAAGSIPMMILSVTVLFQIPQVIVVGSLRGAGDVKFVAMMMLISVTLVRPILAWILCYPLGFGLIGAWMALFLDQITRFTLSFTRYHKGHWTKIIV
ncbi:MAG: MATE family efflux transporter [Erysipelotrichaceae bacterium]|nr:MATE family efflux transporter [Erysipelotrichaceae bacterium]